MIFSLYIKKIRLSIISNFLSWKIVIRVKINTASNYWINLTVWDPEMYLTQSPSLFRLMLKLIFKEFKWANFNIKIGIDVTGKCNAWSHTHFWPVVPCYINKFSPKTWRVHQSLFCLLNYSTSQWLSIFDKVYIFLAGNTRSYDYVLH